MTEAWVPDPYPGIGILDAAYAEEILQTLGTALYPPTKGRMLNSAQSRCSYLSMLIKVDRQAGFQGERDAEGDLHV